VTDKSEIVAATLVGAALGAVTGYMFFTRSGRALRRELEPAITDAAREVENFRRSLFETASVASESWRALTDLMSGDLIRRPSFQATGQSRPF
jgi:hypothetical protein